jgi:hypothetical protein
MLDPGSKPPSTPSTRAQGDQDDGPWACLKPNLKRRIWTLRDGQCRWPLWDALPERDRDRFYCGMPVVADRRFAVSAAPYCRRHCELAFGGRRE